MFEQNVIDKEALKKLVKEKKIKNIDDLNELARNLLKDTIDIMLEEELKDSLGYEKYDYKSKQTDNSRNGAYLKQLRSQLGTFEITMPRDRKSEFEPQLVKKGQKDISGLEEKIISMYAMGLSTRNIQEHIKEIYNFDVSPEFISNVTDSILDKAKAFQSRPLQEIYTIVFLDAMFFKEKKDNQSKDVCLYNIIGIDLYGKKDCLGIYISETENSKYWLGVLNELRNRGVKDILICSMDNLNGFSQAIAAAFPKTDIQKCIVHQLRNSLRFVSYKDRKAVALDLKKIYQAPSEQAALLELEHFESKWNTKYPYISKSWRNNWDELSTFFKYPEEIRSLIYTTNPIESFNSSIRRVTKNKTCFPTQDSLLKIAYLAIENIMKKWTMSIKNWPTILAQLSIYYEDRIGEYL